jgi:hypothetical protein
MRAYQFAIVAVLGWMVASANGQVDGQSLFEALRQGQARIQTEIRLR